MRESLNFGLFWRKSFIQKFPATPSKKKKNDESRYGDVTNLSVFSILHALMFWDPFSRLFLLFSVFPVFSGFSGFFRFFWFFPVFLVFFRFFLISSGFSRLLPPFSAFFPVRDWEVMKYKGKRTSGPPPRGKDRSQKNSFRGWGPWVISYRSSHKRARSANPMESSSEDRQTDTGQSADIGVLKIR